MTSEQRPPVDAVMMDVARSIAKRSTCHRANVGAVLCKETRICATGYNGSPQGQPHCPEDEDVGCVRTVHAEVNAIVFAARNGISTNGATLYTTMSPCIECAKVIVNAGIVRVVYGTPYRVPDGIGYLSSSNLVTVERFTEEEN